MSSDIIIQETLRTCCCCFFLQYGNFLFIFIINKQILSLTPFSLSRHLCHFCLKLECPLSSSRRQHGPCTSAIFPLYINHHPPPFCSHATTIATLSLTLSYFLSLTVIIIIIIIIMGSTRWCPTPEQLMILEEMYRNGVKTPNASQIQHITNHLSYYGKIEGKNVFYWFQNHKARERQKLRRKLAKQLLLQQHQQQVKNFHHPHQIFHCFQSPPPPPPLNNGSGASSLSFYIPPQVIK